ncbi:DNA sulfur modification protein DndB [Paenibacillus sp. GCM10027627]|uniref:DNA sulfur modification protein DndB n=1 Tax=unclassified Paenibacillus TaxID=185978 RepID=UPI0036268C84
MSEVQEKSTLDAISGVLTEVAKNKEHLREINELLSSRHRIPHGTINEILVNNEKFETFSIEEQGAVVSVIFEVTGLEESNPENFFNQKQIGKIRKFKMDTTMKLTLPHTFGNFVVQSTENDYITSLKIKEIGALWNSKILEYSMDIQRKPKEKVSRKGDIIRSPKVIQKSINEITDLVKRDKYRSNTITLCILMDGTEEVTYDDGELTLVAGKLYVIDGYHRLSAFLNVLEDDPDKDLPVDVAIKYLTFDEARFYLGQINKMSKFDKSFVNYLMNDKLQDKIITDVERKSVLQGRITPEATVAKKKTYLTSFNVLSNGVKDIFDPKDNKDRLDIAEVLVNFFDYLIDYYPQDFSKDINTLIQARENSLRNYHNTFVIYLVIAKCLFDKYGKNIPTDEIIRLVELFDYSRDGEYSKVLFSEGTGKVNSNQVKKNIREYAFQKVRENL